MSLLPSILFLQKQLESKKVSSKGLVSDALSNIASPNGQGKLAFTKVYTDQALLNARLSDKLRASGQARSPLEGLPISVKDSFDVIGDVTTAGSLVLKNHPAAQQNATVIQRLINAGAVLVGRTNMTEFAFSGLGLNPHYGSPSSLWDRTNRRISGGSSSGAGVAVASQMSVVSIGTDTGGSVRIPAAFCGITGFKPTASKIPAQGVLPLSFSLDSSGPLGATVECCAITYAILAGKKPKPLNIPKIKNLRFAVPTSLILEGADAEVTQTFERTLHKINQAGAQIDHIHIPEFEQLAYINRNGGLTAAEAWFWHKNIINKNEHLYDPRVVSRILAGKNMSAADYIEVLQKRIKWIVAVQEKIAGYDALLMPTSPIIAPKILELETSDDHYYPANLKILRNPALINFLDGCATSIPCHEYGQAPVGLTVAGGPMQDYKILCVSAALEAMLEFQNR